MNTKKSFKGLALVALLITAAASLAVADPVCKTEGQTEVCYTLHQDANHPSLAVSLKAFEIQTDYLPLVGWWVVGRVLLNDGNVAPIRVLITRDDWAGCNYGFIKLPDGTFPVGVQHLTIEPLREDGAEEVY